MTTYLNRFQHFTSLSRVQQRTLVASWAWLPLFSLGLRVMGLPGFRALLQRKTVRGATVMTLPGMQALGEAVNIAARHMPYPATCLTRSLLMNWLLHRRGVPSDLRIGVRITNGTLDAHAWVEVGGVPVNDRPDVVGQFMPFGDLVPLGAFDVR